jgi:hypothetical protein
MSLLQWRAHGRGYQNTRRLASSGSEPPNSKDGFSHGTVRLRPILLYAAHLPDLSAGIGTLMIELKVESEESEVAKRSTLNSRLKLTALSRVAEASQGRSLHLSG